ncbi:MAG: alpha/beta hydrolase [Streptosporangiaceae bacterium]
MTVIGAAVGSAASAAAAGTVRPGQQRIGTLVSSGPRQSRSSAAHRQPIRVGSVTMPPCKSSRLAWCTTINVPYDYGHPAAGTIKLGFEWYPATAPAYGRAAGTILAIQGGPGYATTDYAPAYRATFLPLLKTRNLLLVNLRGTGNSSSFTCKALQNWALADGTAAYATDTGRCGWQLNHTRKLKGSSRYVQGSDLYTTAIAARDVALLLGRLRTGKADLYGDSYGTFFSQVFTSRFASMLRSVTLDAAYPVSQTDPWYPETIRTARSAFSLACRRSVACAAAAPGSSWGRIVKFASYLRAHPVTGKTLDPYGDVLTETVGVDQLIELINVAGTDQGVYRELDPAIRAVLDDHDNVPLLRLAAMEIYTGNSGPASQFNDGSYQATTCLDYPQPFSYAASPAQRLAEYNTAVAALPKNLFAPFTAHEWVSEPEEEFDACLDWPAPPKWLRPIDKTPTPYAPRTLPVLVLSGDLDSLTTPYEGRATARAMGPSARWILIRNDVHINALDDTFGCAEGLVRTFIADPASLKTMNASCARHTPEVRVLGSFPVKLGQVTAARPAPGNSAVALGRRLAADGTAAVGDAIWNWYYGDGAEGFGLRGGHQTFSGPATDTVIKLYGVRWTRDTSVHGHALWNQVTGFVRAWLTIDGPGGSKAAIRLSYHDYVWHSVATITGTFDGIIIAARMPAP